MFPKSILLTFAVLALASFASAAETAKPTTAATTKPSELQTVTMIIKEMLPFDGGVVIKPEGGGKALVLNEAANNKVFTTAKMQKLQKAHEDHTSIKFLVSDTKVVDILD